MDFSLPVVNALRSPSAFLPSVTRSGILRGTGSVLWRRDCFSAGLPARREKRGLSRFKGRWGNARSPHPSLRGVSPLSLHSSLSCLDINGIYFFPNSRRGFIDLPPLDPP